MGTAVQRPIWLFVAGAVGAITIAIASLLVEEVFNQGWSSTRIWNYVCWLALSLLFWSIAAGWRLFLSKAAGTLYYVRMMPTAARNWHIDAQEAARRRFLGSVQVVHSIDLAAESGVIDLREDVSEVGSKLQDLFNSDDDKTGFMLVPDLLAPVAVALGYRLNLPPGTMFYDLGDSGKTGTSIDSWALEDGPNRNEPQPRMRTTVGPGTCGIHIHASFTAIPDYKQISRPVRESRELGIWQNVDDNDWQAKQRTDVRVGVHGEETHPASAARAWAQVIRSALHDGNGEPVLLTARVPKTVSLAMGYLLAPAHTRAAMAKSEDPGCGVEGCRQDSCRNPWKYLVPLNYNPGTNGWDEMWLLREQRDPRELLALLGTRP